MSNFNYNGTSYEIITTAKTWAEAKVYAESVNGYLAIVTSQAENDALISEALNYLSSAPSATDGGDARYVWIGGSDIASEGSFKWVNNTNISDGYSNWGSGFLNEPDDYEGQDALAMALEPWPAGRGGIGTAGKWNDIDENNFMYFVVEFNPTSIESATTATLGDNFSTLRLTGSQKIDGTGNSLNNNLTGNSAANVLNGLAGNDTLDGSFGSDTLIGGLGDDTYYVDAIKDLITEKPNEGRDTVISIVTYSLGKELEDLVLSGSLAIKGNGNALANNITGNAAANSINGGAGNDTIYGQAGNDIIITTSGLDWVYGGEGNDKITGSKDEDHIEGDDGNDTIVGAAGNDALWGSSGNDSIKADAGNDYIWGGTGNDTLTGGAGKDRFHFGEATISASNVDTITDFKDDEIYLYSNSFINHNFISVNLLTNATSGEGIIYEKSTGTLYYDIDGAGSGDLGVAFAILTGKSNITLSNFLF